MAIVLYTANDQPYGKLRNDYQDNLTIDNETWLSPDNYVFSNLLPNRTVHKQILKFTPSHQVRNEYYKIRTNLEQQILSSAINKGIIAKLTEPVFKNALIETKNSTLIYKSANPFLGGMTENSLNVVGKWLEHHRNILLSEMKIPSTVDNDNEIFDSYLAEHGLKLALKKGNLSQYEGLPNLKAVVRQLIKDLSKEAVLIINKETALAIQSKRKITPFKEPSTLISYIRKTFIKEVQRSNESLRSSIIFEVFVNYIIQTQYTQLITDIEQRNFIREEQLKTISLDAKHKLIQRTVNIFENDGFDSELTSNIEAKISNIYIPTKEELTKYQELIVPVPKPEEDVVDSKIDNIQQSTQYIEQSSVLSLTDSSVKLKIDGYEYPSITHYMFVMTVSSLPGYESIMKAHTVIMKSNGKYIDVKDIDKLSSKLKKETLSIPKYELLKKALTVKFSIPSFKLLLLSLGKSKLIYKGNWGEETVKMINDIRRDVLPEEGEYDGIESLVNSIDYDDFLQEWVVNRIKDITFIIKSVQIYLFQRHNQKAVLSSLFIRKVLTVFYGPYMEINLPSYPAIFDVTLRNIFFIKPERQVTTRSISYEGSNLIYDSILTGLVALWNILLNSNEVTAYMFSDYFKVGLINSIHWASSFTLKDPLALAVFNLASRLTQVEPTNVSKVEYDAAVAILSGKLLDFTPLIMIDNDDELEKIVEEEPESTEINNIVNIPEHLTHPDLKTALESIKHRKLNWIKVRFYARNYK